MAITLLNVLYVNIKQGIGMHVLFLDYIQILGLDDQ